MKTVKPDTCKICSSNLNDCKWPELIDDGFCSYDCQDDYYDLMEDRYYQFDRYDYKEGRPF